MLLFVVLLKRSRSTLHELCSLSALSTAVVLFPGGPNYKNSYSSNTAMLCIVRHTAIATAKKSLAVRPAISDILCHGETRITIRWNRARLDEERKLTAASMQPLESPDNRAARDLHRTMSATAARTTTHAWPVPPQRHAARARRLVGQTDRHVESGIDLRYCREARLQGECKNRGCCWAASGGREKILIKGSSMKGVLFKQHSLVAVLGGVA